MKRPVHTVRVLSVLVAIAAFGAPLGATDVTVSLDLASAYVFRGVTFNDGAVLQPGLKASGFQLGELEIPLTLGFWGNLDLNEVKEGGETVADSGKFSEVNLFAEIEMPVLIQGLDWLLGYTEYLYPQDGGDPDREVYVGFSVDTLLDPSFTIHYGLDGAIEKSTFLEFALEHEIDLGGEVALELGATLGYAIPDEGDSGFNNLDLTAGLSWKALSISVTYIAQLDDKVLTDDAYDTKVVGMLSLSKSF